VQAATVRDLDIAFASLAGQNIRALMVGNDPYFLGRRDQIVALAAHYSISAIYFAREFMR
jgi:hypothetical protein